MAYIFTIIYLVIYLILNILSIHLDISQKEPIWFLLLNVICSGTAALCIFLYILRFRPKALSVLWKTLPFLIVAFNLFSFYYELFVSSSQESMFDIAAIFIIVLIVIFPSWFLCFRFGYLKEIDKCFNELSIKKAIFVSLTAFVIGLAIGGIATMAYSGFKFSSTIFMFQEREIFEMEAASEKAYYEQPAEVAIWALENYISTLNRVKEERGSAGAESPYFILSPDRSLIYSHARLGQLYKKLNNDEKQKYHFDMAMSKSKEIKFPKFDTEEQLVDFIHRLDSETKVIGK